MTTGIASEAPLWRHGVTLVWALLVAATCLSWWLGTNDDPARDLRYVSTLLMVVAFVKVRFVIRYFMEVRHAALALKLLADLWVAGVCLAVLTLYWTAA